MRWLVAALVVGAAAATAAPTASTAQISASFLYLIIIGIVCSFGLLATVLRTQRVLVVHPVYGEGYAPAPVEAGDHPHRRRVKSPLRPFVTI